jgi:SAM-dependent methyltransferase
MDAALDQRFRRDEIGLWVPAEGKRQFGYSDGAWVEKYLESAFREAADLSSESEELETYIKDWNTEYHLSRKRKDILAGLHHNRSAKVLEIGSGCGAITRFLGEAYDNVVAVEGSYNRARLARLRTRDLGSVEVYASRYQDLGLEGAFDIVFCIGVLEYAPSYVDGNDPFHDALKSMRRMLRPGGTLVLAIENKLGLKYFSNSTEDHSGTFFEGIEGYPRTNRMFETFGKVELQRLLSSYWDDVQFYYPFPDYKMPSLLLSDEGAETLEVGEMLAGLPERDYARINVPLFDNRLAWREVARNGLVSHLSNSFLAVAGPTPSSHLAPTMAGRFATMFNRERRACFTTRTDIEAGPKGVVARKAAANPQLVPKDGPFLFAPRPSEWMAQETIAYRLFRLAHDPKVDRATLLAGITAWWAFVKSSGLTAGTVPGDMLDAVWHNCCQMPDGSIVRFDHEFACSNDMDATVLFVRAAFQWHVRYSSAKLPHLLSSRGVDTVRRIARELSIPVSPEHVRHFIDLEARLQSSIGHISEERARRGIRAALYIPHLQTLTRYYLIVSNNVQRAKRLLRRISKTS